MIAAAVLMVPVMESRLNHNRVVSDARAAEIRLGAKPGKVSQIQGLPTKIIVPNLGIDLPVVLQYYSPVIKSWPVSPSAANYAAETSLINNVHGQSLIYGHDTRGIFGPLANLTPGDTAYVYTSNDHIFKYSYSGSQDVSPKNVNIISQMPKMPSGLNLITCSGAHFQYRHLMSFKLVQAS